MNYLESSPLRKRRTSVSKILRSGEYAKRLLAAPPKIRTSTGGSVKWKGTPMVNKRGCVAPEKLMADFAEALRDAVAEQAEFAKYLPYYHPLSGKSEISSQSTLPMSIRFRPVFRQLLEKPAHREGLSNRGH